MTRVYQKPYPDYYDQLPYPRGYRVPEYSKFSEEDGKTTLEHVGQFILQYGEISSNDTLKLRMYPLSLSGTAFTWFTSLVSNSIFTWVQLEQKFHEYFYSGDTCRGLVPRVPQVAGYGSKIQILSVPTSSKRLGNHAPRTGYDPTIPA
jgi:hypothetical protein